MPAGSVDGTSYNGLLARALANEPTSMRFGTRIWAHLFSLGARIELEEVLTD